MKTPLVFLFLLAFNLATADTLDLILRCYDASGKAVNPKSMSIQVDSGKASITFGAEDDIWQHWKLYSANNVFSLHLVSGNEVQDFLIDVHPDFRERLRILVIDRLQYGSGKKHLKVNHLSCSWNGSLAKPIEYAYRNPFDGELLIAQRASCLNPEDSADARIHFISDSVMLLTCGRKAGIFIKYFLAADGRLNLYPTQFTCTRFNSPAEEQLYRGLTDPDATWRLSMQGDRILLEEKKCRWEFRFSR